MMDDKSRTININETSIEYPLQKKIHHEQSQITNIHA